MSREDESIALIELGGAGIPRRMYLQDIKGRTQVKFHSTVLPILGFYDNFVCLLVEGNDVFAAKYSYHYCDQNDIVRYALNEIYIGKKVYRTSIIGNDNRFEPYKYCLQCQQRRSRT